jgi:toxin ParE1/3/4
VEQRDRYVAQLRERIGLLRERPHLAPEVGRRRPGLRRLSVGSHIVFYRFDDERIFVVRILDQRMDLDAHLDQSADDL